MIVIDLAISLFQYPLIRTKPEMAKSLHPYELEQRQHTLAIVLWIVLVGALALGVDNLQYQTWTSTVALFVLAILCVPLLIMNARGYGSPAGIVLSILILLAINLNLYYGDGILDAGLLAYPIFIMTGTLFFGKRAAIYFALATIASVSGIVYLQIKGIIIPTVNPTNFDSITPIAILLIIASVVVWAIVQNIEASLQRVRDSEVELRQNYEATLEAWAKVLEYRDRETEDHSRRLVELSNQLGRAAGCSEEQLLYLRRGALMHDIGKLAVPDEILLKPAALTDEEREAIQKHPIYAKQMLSGIKFLEPAIDVAYSHHERWDGKGYPQGLRGEQIPLLARIFAIVDTWDALNSPRIYRQAWAKSDIITYIKENAGIRFDPQLVNIFVQIAEE